jgi:Icc-related predicted phosphoesterase
VKILLISDLHSQKKTLAALERIIKRDKFDGLICAGDIAQGNDIEFLEKLFGIIEKNKLPIFLIWGNSEGELAREFIINSPYNIHLQRKKLGNLSIVGIAGVDEVAAFDTKILKDAILVTHRPPLKRTLNSKYPNSPKYHLSGHLHFAACSRVYPATIHIQIPTLQAGRFGIFDPEQGQTEFFFDR